MKFQASICPGKNGKLLKTWLFNKIFWIFSIYFWIYLLNTKYFQKGGCKKLLVYFILYMENFWRITEKTLPFILFLIVGRQFFSSKLFPSSTIVKLKFVLRKFEANYWKILQKIKFNWFEAWRIVQVSKKQFQLETKLKTVF